VRCTSAGAERRGGGLCADPAYVVIPQAEKKKTRSILSGVKQLRRVETLIECELCVQRCRILWPMVGQYPQRHAPLRMGRRPHDCLKRRGSNVKKGRRRPPTYGFRDNCSKGHPESCGGGAKCFGGIYTSTNHDMIHDLGKKSKIQRLKHHQCWIPGKYPGPLPGTSAVLSQ
jgi:hypothetical protein